MYIQHLTFGKAEHPTVTVTISRWGNSLAVRIPKEALDRAGLREGDALSVLTENGRIVLTPQTAAPSLDELVARITPENLHEQIFENIVGRETW